VSRFAVHREQSSSPSRWDRRLAAAGLAATGCGIATYLTLYQLRVVADVWEPFFGNGSRHILRESAISRSLPVPDAALGAAGYLIEAVAECLGDRERWRTWPTMALVAGTAAAGLGLAAVVLVAFQVFWFHAYCTLCLASALCSLVIAALAAPEAYATVKHFRKSRRRAVAATGGIRLT